jgi:hypothetical protein
MQKYLFTLKIDYEQDIRKIEGTRAEEWKGIGSLVVYDGDAVVARFPDKVASWSAEKQSVDAA